MSSDRIVKIEHKPLTNFYIFFFILTEISSFYMVWLVLILSFFDNGSAETFYVVLRYRYDNGLLPGILSTLNPLVSGSF